MDRERRSRSAHDAGNVLINGMSFSRRCCDVAAQYPEFTGTPSFVINGKLLEQTSTWDKLEPQLRDAIGS